MEIIKRNFVEFCGMYGQDSETVVKVWEALGSDDCWLGGGAIRRTLIGQPLDSDFDFFFESENALESFKSRCDKIGLVKVKETKHHIQFEGKLEGSELPIVVQAIFFKYYQTRRDVLDSFDYTITQFLFNGEYMWTTPEALWDLGRKRLVIHRVSYPVATMRRMLKYTNQGFTACAGCMKTLFVETASNPDAMAELDIEYVD